MRDGLLGLYPLSLVTDSIKLWRDVSNLHVISPETRICYSAECVEELFSEVRVPTGAAKITHLSDAPGARRVYSAAHRKPATARDIGRGLEARTPRWVPTVSGGASGATGYARDRGDPW